jgi:UDP-glucose 4-epimerase
LLPEGNKLHNYRLSPQRPYGSQYRNFIYVEDLAEGNVLALNEVAKNKIYNLEGIRPITIREIANTICKVIGNVEIKFVEARPGDFKGKNVSIRKAMDELNWRPKIDLEEGIRRYVNWFKECLRDEK